jgi:transketolase
MINPDAFLNQKLFDDGVEKVSPREGFGEGLVAAGQENNNLVVVCADLKESVKVGAFAEKFPQRFIEVGVAEQNLVTVASGLAAEGKIPFAVSYAAFSPGRNWEQIRTTICYNNRPVKIIGSHAGVITGPDGATHQALEDIALMRVLPNMIVISPADSLEAKKATQAIAKNGKPCYLRLPRTDLPVITSDQTPFEIGKAQVLYEGKDVTVVATGALVYPALLAAKELEMNKISVRVINCHTIKPLDKQIILKAAEETGAIVTAEDHQVAGGLGSTVAELISQELPVPIKIIGINDQFGQSGEPEELMVKYSLTKEAIIQGITKVLRIKHR